MKKMEGKMMRNRKRGDRCVASEMDLPNQECDMETEK